MTPCRALVFAALIAMTGAAASAEGRVKRGVRAPPFDTTATVGIEAFRLDDRRGRFVFLQFFSVRCTHCQGFVPRMNAILDRYADRGLVVVGVSHESKPEILDFRRRYGARYPVALTHFDVLREYDVEAYPTGFLLAPNGRVLWRGNPERMPDRVFDAYLAKFPLLPEATARYAWVTKRISEGRFEEVLDALEKQRECRAISPRDCAYVLGTLDWIDGYARSSMAAAQADEAAGRWYDAWWTYDHLARAYGNRPAAQEAATRRDALRAEPLRAHSIDAFRAFVGARSEARTLSPAQGAKLLADVAAKYAGTDAGNAAGALAKAWAEK